MGVVGLQTFLKDNRQSLCKTIQLPQGGGQGVDQTRIVVDAWGLIFQLYLDSLPWTSGGEYHEFYLLVRRLVTAWRSVGMEPTFVFDGASPLEKHQTTIDRLQQHVGISRLFYTTSPTSRSSPSFSRYSAILPPFASHTFIHALHSLDVSTHFVAEGEADAMGVTIAAKLGALVLGRDSDFVILIGAAKSDSVKGYCPLDMMMWIEGEVESEPATAYTTVHRRQGSQLRTSSLLPPSTYRNPTLVLINYPPQSLRHRLRLPGSLLPLFASLAGNDYTPPELRETFFEPGMNACQRIEKVARILREQVFSQKNTATGDVGDRAVDMVRKVVKKLAVRGYVLDNVDELVNAIIEATFQYTLPSLDNCCSVYPFCGGSDECTPSAAAGQYAAAQKRGLLSSITHGYLYPSRNYLWSVLEDPQNASIRASQGLRQLRTAAWAIADQKLGLLFPEAEQDNPLEAEDDLDILGVDKPSIPRVITEYGRQGSSNRVSTSTLELTDPLPLPPLELYLTHLNSKTELIQSLPIHLQPLAAIVRFCITNFKWRHPEILAVLKAGLGVHDMWNREPKKAREEELPILTNRNADIVAQLSATMTDSCLLAQALLLIDETHIRPFIFFSGTTIHHLLAITEPTHNWRWNPALEETLQTCVRAVEEGLDIVSPRTRKVVLPDSPEPVIEKKKKGKKVAPTIGKGRFDALGEISA